MDLWRNASELDDEYDNDGYDHNYPIDDDGNIDIFHDDIQSFGKLRKIYPKLKYSQFYSDKPKYLLILKESIKKQQEEEEKRIEEQNRYLFEDEIKNYYPELTYEEYKTNIQKYNSGMRMKRWEEEEERKRKEREKKIRDEEERERLERLERERKRKEEEEREREIYLKEKRDRENLELRRKEIIKQREELLIMEREEKLERERLEKQKIIDKENEIKKLIFEENEKIRLIKESHKMARKRKNQERRNMKDCLKDKNNDYVSKEPKKVCVSKYHLLYNYLQNVRVNNVLLNINKLLIKYENELENKSQNQEILCNQIKIFNDLFNYKQFNFKYTFEAVFELVSGIELLDEQMERYVQIINSFIDYENKFNKKQYKHYELKGKVYDKEDYLIGYQYGGAFNYPLHHIMMSKGKSAILNPLLALHFALIYDKIVYIIVPPHLKPPTEEKFESLKIIFDCNEKIIIMSDVDVKYKYLNGDFKSNKNSVMIIDEFDSLIDPMKSNFNVTKEKINFDEHLCELVKKIVIHLYDKDDKYMLKISDITNLSEEINTKYCEYYEILETDINDIIHQIKNNNLIENINWGIHPKYYYAIPYNNKDKALESSNFTSSIMTLFLTFYYYIIIQDYSLNEYIIEIIINKQLLYYINEEHTEVKEKIIEIWKSIDEKSRNIIFDHIFKIIFSRQLLSNNQSNVSFIDIINIKDMFKVGYSGTVNINLKPFDYLENKFSTIIDDEDEPINVHTAIMNANILYLNKLEFKKNIDEYFEIFSSYIDLHNFDCLIDLHGLFKNIKNEKIARKINILLKRNVIFLSEEKDKELIILINGEIENYNSHQQYENPFLYFDQGHTIGVDIKQDKYPIMKGLCLLNNKSTYTDVAQAIFRLRKINLGHTIDLCLVYEKYIEYDIDELLDLFILNDKEKQEQTNDLLIFQTLKYQIRINKKNEEIMKNHEEVIKYYYESKTKIPLKSELDKFFEGIFTLEEIEYLRSDEKLSPLFRKIYDYKKLLKLIYNIGNTNTNITHSLETELGSDIDAQKSKQAELRKSFEFIKPIDIKDLGIIYPTYDFIMYNYIFNFMNDDKIFNLLTLHVVDNLYCLPNIFIQNNGFNFNINKSGLLFVYINNKFLIIPGYMIMIFIDNYIILTINQIILNSHLCKKQEINKRELFDKMEELKLIIYIKNKIVFEKHHESEGYSKYLNINDPLNILLGIIIIYIKNENQEYLSLDESKIHNLNLKINQKYKEWLTEKPIRQLLLINESYTIDQLNDKIQIFQDLPNNPSLYKYLKYKLKYYLVKYNHL